MGMSGAGKSYSHLQIAAAYPGRKFFILDTDDSIPRLLALEFPRLKNVIVFPCRDWTDCVKALEAIRLKIAANDWLVIDMLCTVWDYVQSYFVEEIFNRDIGTYFLQMRKSMKTDASNLNALKGWTDWSVVNKLYQSFINEICYQIPASIFFTCKATKLSTEDDATTQDMFSVYGVKPEGEKRNVFRVHTVLLLSHGRQGFTLSTIKDRGRVRLENVPLTENMTFAIRYLQVVAGWEPEQ
jgi:hypothetical protein